MVISSGGRFCEALSLMEQAIEHDLDHGPALAWAAFCHMRACQDGRSEDPEADGRIGIDLARRALEAIRDDPGTIVNAALALSYFGEDNGAMLVDRALTLNPSFARGWHVSGVLRLRAGEPDLAIQHVETSLRPSPRARSGCPW